MLQEEIQYLGPVRVSDVEAAQQAIVDTVRRLEDAGEIVVNTGESERLIA
jgi:flagellar motor switch protein FliG